MDKLPPYHLLLTISWTGFLATVVVTYFALNIAFAAAFLACGPDAIVGAGAPMLGGRVAQAFFFSVQTFATIGYGQIGPNGFAANALVTIEALVGLIFQALATCRCRMMGDTFLLTSASDWATSCARLRCSRRTRANVFLRSVLTLGVY